jgi:hypothetical protein
MKRKIKFMDIFWPKRYIEPYRAGPGVIFPTRVMALFIILQSIIGFMVGVLAIGFLRIARLSILKLLLKNAKFGSVEIDDLRVKRLHIDQKV